MQETRYVPPSAENDAEQLKQAVLSAQEHHDAWLRAKAEADNIRKRAQADITSAHKYAIENFSSDLLAVKDSLEAALAAEGQRDARDELPPPRTRAAAAR